MGYFFFDFKDAGKQDVRALLSSLIVQLCSRSDSSYDILHGFYSAHHCGLQQPSVRALSRCLENMLKVPGQLPTYIIVDALDESPDTSGMQSSREKVLEFIEALIGLHLPNLRLCVTSRPEVDIRIVLESLTSTYNRISLHDESGQQKDIIDYVSSVVYLDRKMKKWREEDKKRVIEALSEGADGM